MDKLIVYGAEARNRILDGANLLRNIVASTLGPRGHNVIINNGGVRPLITKDGKTVSDHVDSDDPFEKVGIQLVKDVVGRVNSLAGDGTTTTTLYTVELLNSISKLINLGVDANDLRYGMNIATQKAVQILESLAKKIDDIQAIAEVASNDDGELVKLLVEAYNGIGENGSVILADSYRRNGESYVDISNGIRWQGGIPSSLFITNIIDDTAVIENPLIMIFASGLYTLEPLLPYFEIAKQQNRNLVLIAPFFESKLWSQAVSHRVCMLTSPGTSFSHIEIHDALMDLAITVGTKVIPDVDKAIEVVPDLNDLGKAKLIVASVKETNITQVEELDEKYAEEYAAYIEKLKEKINDDKSELSEIALESLKDRLARLSGGIATIHIGALTPTEKEEKIALLEDAQNSISSALQYGVLPGGGTALLKVAQQLQDEIPDFESDAKRKGYETVVQAMRLPAKQLVSSVKPEDYQYIVQQVAHEKDFWTGYNVRHEKIEDLKKSKIFDSAAIEIFALKYAASGVNSFAISDGIIVNKANNIKYDMNDRKVVEGRF